MIREYRPRGIGQYRLSSRGAGLHAAFRGNHPGADGTYDPVFLSLNYRNALAAGLSPSSPITVAAPTTNLAPTAASCGIAASGVPGTAGPLNQPAMLKWVLQHPEITTAIPGYTTFDQLNESFTAASGLGYTAEEKAWLADKDVKLAIDFCQQCGTCLATCPRGVDVPTLMRTHMYAANYSNFDQARRTLEEIPEHAGLTAPLLRLCTRRMQATFSALRYAGLGVASGRRDPRGI